MSPEQLRSRPADERSDVWAFGCVLHEMLTGRQPFHGETVTDLSAEIVRIEPNWNALPVGTPAGVRSAVKLCLEKDRRRRLHAIGDVRIGLEEGGMTPVATAAAVPKRRERLAWVVAGVFAIFATGVLIAAIYFYPKATPVHSSRFLIEIPSGANIGPTAVASSSIAYPKRSCC